jgi:hypothetical protein
MSESGNLIFDDKGHLKPYTFIETDLLTFEQVFVTGFPDSTSRRKLFDNYRKYIDDFRQRVCDHFTQWVDGSFVTRKINPRDIDLVTFLAGNVYDTKQRELALFTGLEMHRDTGLDCYFVKVHPGDSPEYLVYQADRAQWLHQFGYTRRNPATNQRSEKGFIQLVY